MGALLEKKVAIITGGIRGIGKAIALAFAEEGANVSVFDLDDESSSLAAGLLREIDRFNGDCIYQKADVTNTQEVRGGVEKTLEVLGKIDILVNNAGGSIIAPVALEDLAEQDWDRVVGVNLKGTYVCSHFVISHMKNQRSGKIINIASGAGRGVSNLVPHPYACSKAGQVHFTRQLALESAPYGINVNCIAPGTVFTERVKKIFEERFDPEERRKKLDNIPLRRPGQPEEIAHLAVFLASNKSNYITGATIDINGGTVMA